MNDKLKILTTEQALLLHAMIDMHPKDNSLTLKLFNRILERGNYYEGDVDFLNQERELFLDSNGDWKPELDKYGYINR